MVPKWNTQTPTEPGWYWWRPSPLAAPIILDVRENGLTRVFVLTWHVEKLAGQWSGPLSPPDGELNTPSPSLES